jgi:hypothetical protein
LYDEKTTNENHILFIEIKNQLMADKAFYEFKLEADTTTES